MQRITIGQLRVFTYDHIYTFPAPGSPAEQSNPRSELKAELRVVSDAFWVRLCTMGDLGFSEGYIYGEVECDDLVGLMTVRPGHSQIFVLKSDTNAGRRCSWLIGKT